MKKIGIGLVSILMLLAPVSAIEWGGLITEDFRYASSDFTLDNTQIKQSNSSCLWLKGPVIPNNALYFAGQISGKYFLDISKDNTNFVPVFDIDLLKLSGSVNIFESNLSLSAGRFSVSDLTSKIFNQNSDGLLLKLSYQNLEVSAYGGLTGLLNGLNNAMLAEGGTVHSITGSGYVLAHNYCPVFLSLEVPSAFLNQTLNLQASGFIDTEKTSYNRFYVTFAINGPIAGPVYYSLVTSLGSENFKKLSNYSALSIQILPVSFFTLKLNAEYASGKQAVFSPFVGFTSSTAYNSVVPSELSGVILPNLDVILTTGSFYTSLNGKLVLAYPESEINIQGLNFSASVIYNIFSDLQCGFSGIYYYDMRNNGKQNNMSMNINLSMSF